MQRPNSYHDTRTVQMKPRFTTHERAMQGTAERFIGNLRRLVLLLDHNIIYEEELTGIFDLADSKYSVTARQLRARRDNLAATIFDLEKHAGTTYH